jgi:exodeoxyribonuclease V alpha subunit
VLQELSGDGHCAAVHTGLVEMSEKLVEIPAVTIEEAIAAELVEENLVEKAIEGQPCLFLTPLHRAEVGVAQRLQALLACAPPWGGIDPDKAIPWVEEKTGVVLSPSQRTAVAEAVNGKITVITGGPGVGKTTVLNSLLRILRAKGVEVLLCAPTGRAAKRLSECTGLEARTIHRVLEFDPKAYGFKRGLEHPLEADLIVLDESSMVDIVLMNQLLRAIPTTVAVLLVGDVDQLPSVGPGAVLADIVASGHIRPCDSPKYSVKRRHPRSS